MSTTSQALIATAAIAIALIVATWPTIAFRRKAKRTMNHWPRAF